MWLNENNPRRFGMNPAQWELFVTSYGLECYFAYTTVWQTVRLNVIHDLSPFLLSLTL